MNNQKLKEMLAAFLVDDSKPEVELLGIAVANMQASDKKVIALLGYHVDEFVQGVFKAWKKITEEAEAKAAAEKKRPNLRVVN